MSMLSKQIAQDVALAYREIEVAEKLLDEIDQALSRRETPDIRDAFGRRTGGLQLGIPSGSNAHQLFDVPWTLARPILVAHIAQLKGAIEALTVAALAEIGSGETP